MPGIAAGKSFVFPALVLGIFHEIKLHRVADRGCARTLFLRCDRIELLDILIGNVD
jgi:hypothetical protein